jgi:hypothetical protein
MRKLILAMGILALSAGVAFAGSNAGIQLHVQGNVLGVDTAGDACANIALPADCEGLVPSAAPEAGGTLLWYLAVAVSPPANSPNFNTVIFGVGPHAGAQNDIGFFGPCHADLSPVEVSSAGWPGPNTGTAVSWAPNCLNGYLEPVYYFAVYSYGPGSIPLGDYYPGQPAGVTSCTAEEDLFAAFGAMGCGGDPGSNPECPGGGPELEACCIGPDCFMLPREDCLAQGGDPQGPGSNCDTNPCDDPTATESTTWGQIKSTYR